ncbi:S9 family peptidase [Marinihelvus fidelis]|uniref:S9 family peptidase n=1 Tax=Marinihelvus fidelis TaxID=2613842 RepID=A0A5N0TCC7_9GAMM|nr:prolyl oligopeptidase family serine peptidase [Marinihelvus fidelis]KAA9132743.1 S9 family peptidase [Marinihelvus fidelis]
MISKTLRPLLAACLGLSTAPVLAKPIPVESFAKLPNISSVSMSTDGKQLVAIVAAPGSNNQDTAVATWDVDNLSKGPVVTPSGDRMKFIAANAMKADRILVAARQEWSGHLAGCGEGNLRGSTDTFVFKNYLTDGAHKEFDEAFAGSTRGINVSDAVQRCLELAGSANLVSNLPLDPSKVIISRVDTGSFQSDYYLYDLKNDRAELLFKGNRSETPGLFHPRDGHVVTRNETEAMGNDVFELRVLILDPATGEFSIHDKLTTLLHERYSVNVVGIDDETGKLYVLTDQFSDLVQAWMYDPKTREFDAEPLVAHPRFSIAGLGFGTQPSNFNQLVSFAVDGLEMEVTYVDGDLRSIHEGLKQAFPGKTVRIIDYNDGLSRVLFSTGNAQTPTAYHLVEDRQKVTNLGNSRPWINPEDIGEQRWVTYTARDGMEIPGILDLPAGWSKEDGPLPTLIHPHGGPWSRDRGGWDGSGWVPLLTSRGYAVLRPQYRGSSGLGRKLWLAGDKQWGLAMQDDKDDGAQWLVDQGIADPERLAIFGYSYGGFASVAAVVRPNSPYQCAIAGGPVANLAKLGNTWSENRLQRILQGRTVTGMDPMANADKANIPLLMFTGDRDVRTPDWHATDFEKAVRDKIDVTFVSIPDMPHSMPWYYSHFDQTLNLIVDFLEDDCGPGGL